jgi:5-methylcytosine-specific restriction endonuclease McrA
LTQYKRYKVKPDCGTKAGYDWHRRDQKEEPCESCRTAMKDYWKLQRVIRNEDINSKRREKRRENPYRYQSRRTRARKLNVGFGYYRDEDVINTYGTDCHICNEPIDFSAPRQAGKEGWEKGFQVDHVYPLSRGGEDTLENVRPAHGYCNIVKWATV